MSWGSLIRFLIALVVGYGFLVGYMVFNQENFIYFPNDQDFESCEGFSESDKVVQDGTRMYHTDVSDNLVVYYHGNAGSACDRFFIKDLLKDAGYSSIFVEYAGYSNDERTPSKSLILEDVGNVDEFLSTLDYGNLIFMGTSLGSSVAAYHRTLRSPDKMVLFGSFDKLSSLGQEHYPHMPVDFLLKEDYETVNWLGDFKGNILLVHGSEDEIVPMKLSRRLFEALESDNKEFLKVPEENHNTLLGNESMWSKVLDFMAKGVSD